MSTITEEEILKEELSGIAIDAVSEIRKEKKIIPLLLGALCFLVAIVYFLYILPLRKEAKEVGEYTGSQLGQVAGAAAGTVEGLTTGVQSGYVDGKTEGLSAKDTEIEVGNRIRTNINGLGELQVLAANVSFTNTNKVGKKYAALETFRGNLVFSVNLSEATINYTDENITIKLPEPTCTLAIDPNERKIVWERQRRMFDGTDKNGFDEEINSFLEIANKSINEIENYPFLVELAKQTALEQVEKLTESSRGKSDIPLSVEFFAG